MNYPKAVAVAVFAIAVPLAVASCSSVPGTPGPASVITVTASSPASSTAPTSHTVPTSKVETPASTSVSSAPAGDTTFDLAGVLTLYGSGATEGQTCEGDGDYSDIVKGTEISVYTASTETLVGLGTLSDGVQDADGCSFTFSVNNLPTNGGGTSGWLVGVADRGTVPYSNDEFAHIIYLSLGK
jgi:hypothetical protein